MEMRCKNGRTGDDYNLIWCKGSVDVEIASISRQRWQLQPLKVIVELVQKSGELIGSLRENGELSQFSSVTVENEHVVEGVVTTIE